MLAATALLASSAISATCSPARTARHVSTAFRAPGINLGNGDPKLIPTILLDLRFFSSAGVLRSFFSQLTSRPAPGPAGWKSIEHCLEPGAFERTSARAS